MSALDKAERLYSYAKHQGSPLTDFMLTVSTEEGFELLDYFAAQYPGNELFETDVAYAKISGDPFVVLANFTLMGFHIVPKTVLN